jgi:hypothetical protein
MNVAWPPESGAALDAVSRKLVHLSGIMLLSLAILTVLELLRSRRDAPLTQKGVRVYGVTH